MIPIECVMELFVARQPIFDAYMRVFGYELLYRSGPRNEFDGARMNPTEHVINTILGAPECDGWMRGRPLFINFPRSLLLDDTASILPPTRTVIEILESVEPDEAVVAACNRLRAQGYRLALDDFVVAEPAHPLVPLLEFLKVDFRASSRMQQKAAAARFQGKVRLLAEKVETREEFCLAAQMGYEYFQGYFFARPVITSAREVPGFKLNYLRILRELHRPEFQFHELAELLKREPVLSCKLLRFVNSALFNHHVPIESIQQALLYIGEDSARRWLSVIVLLDLAADQPGEFAVDTLLRARFAELLARESNLAGRSESCFLMGMFSRLDTMLGRPLEELLDGLNLHEEINRALLDRALPGDRLPLLWKAVQAYEAADWDGLDGLAVPLGLRTDALAARYAEALIWVYQVSHP
jgi:c-di-GMP-related signal transduction protein